VAADHAAGQLASPQPQEPLDGGDLGGDTDVAASDGAESDVESIDGEPEVGAITDMALAERLVGTRVLIKAGGDFELATITKTTRYSGTPFLIHLAAHDGNDLVTDLTFVEVLRAHQLYLESINLQPAPLVLTPDLANGNRDGLPFAPHPHPATAPIATPSSFVGYEFKIAIDSVLYAATVLGRTITQGHAISWLLKLVAPGGATTERSVAHHDVNEAITVAKKVARVAAPKTTLPRCDAFVCASSLTLLAGAVTDHPMVGLQGHVAASLADDVAAPTRGKRQKKKSHHVSVEAVLPRAAGQHGRTIYLCRLVAKPTLCVCLNYAQFADARHALEVHRFSKQRGKKSARIAHAALADDPDYPVLGTAQAAASIQQLAATLPDVASDFFGLGFVADRRRLPPRCKRQYRRALDSVARVAEDGDSGGTKVLLAFHALVAPPVPKGGTVKVDRAKWIASRIRLFRQGRWSELRAGGAGAEVRDDFYPMRRSPRPPEHTPSNPLVDPDDAKAAKAQYTLTALGSVKAASQQLFSPPNIPPAAPGAVSAALRKLHPQVGDPLPAVPDGPAPLAVVGGASGDCPARFEARASALPRFRSPLSPPSAQAAAPLQFTAEQYIAAVRRRDPASAGGPDGLTFLAGPPSRSRGTCKVADPPQVPPSPAMALMPT